MSARARAQSVRHGDAEPDDKDRHPDGTADGPFEVLDVVEHFQFPIPNCAMSDQDPVKVVDRRWWARAVAEDAPAEATDQASIFDKPSYVQELEQQLAAIEKGEAPSMVPQPVQPAPAGPRAPEGPPPPAQSGS